MTGSSECPAAIRTFLAKADMEAAYAQAKDAITQAGFSITDEYAKGCPSGSSNSPSCSFFADRGDEQALVQVFSSPARRALMSTCTMSMWSCMRIHRTDR